MAGPLALLVPAVKALAAGGGKTALAGAAKGVGKGLVKDTIKGKAKKFVTGKKKDKKGKGGSLVKSATGEERQEETGGEIFATTPMVGNYRVQKPPEKPDVEGKQSEVSFESINNQLDSITGLTEALKKTSQGRLKTAENKKKAERKAAEKAKKRQRESMLERGAGAALGLVGGAVSKALPFDPLKFFIMTFLGSLLLWIMENGSKIIGFLKATLALMNNLGKLILKGIGVLGKGIAKALKFVIKGFPGLGKLAKGFKGIFKSLGSKLAGALGKIGNGLKNMAKGLIKKLKALGKFIMSPKGNKPPKGTPKGLAQAVKPGKMSSNAARAIKLKHGAEAAERFQRLVDKGMDPAKASRKVNKAIKAGKIVSKPAKAAGKVGSKLAQKAGEKSLVTVSKGALKFLKRIPVIGGLITLVVSLLSGDPISQALFKTGGAVLGGFLGSFIPIPVIGTLLGELVGEYIGDLMYHLLMGGGPEAVGQKMKEDIEGLLKVGTAALNWAGDGFKRLMDGLPKFKVPEKILGVPIFGIGGAEVINPLPLLANPLMVIPKVYKAFFTRDPMGEGVVDETNKDPNEKEKIEIQPEMKEKAPEGYREDLENEPPVQGMRPGTGPAAPILPPATGVSAANITPNMSRRDKFMLIYNAAVAAGDPMPALSAAQSMFETGFLSSELSLNANNPYGQTGRGDAGTYDYGKYPNVTWASYSSYNAAIKAHVKRWSVKTPQGNPGYATYNNPMEAMRGIIENYAPGSENNHPAYLSGVESILREMGFDPNAPEKPQVRSSATTPQVQPTTPMAATPSTGSVTTGSVTPTTQMIPQQATGPALGGLGGNSGSVAYNGQENAPLSVSYSPFSQSDISSQGMRIISGKGYRRGTSSVHKGLDIPSVAGTPVYAYLPGKITQNRRASGYGNLVEWKDSVYGEKHMFAHLQAPSSLKVGQEFPAGTMLARTGDTGSPGSYHLHWEIGSQGAEKDPSKWVAAHPNTGEVRTRPQSSASQVTPTTTGTTRTGGGSVTTGSGSATVTRSSTAGSGSISAISSQLPYESPGGGGVIMMAPTADNRNVMVGSSGGGAGTPVIVGSGDVVNSYYKAQLLGFLYKQG